jgi:hypothetical protein
MLCYIVKHSLRETPKLFVARDWIDVRNESYHLEIDSIAALPRLESFDNRSEKLSHCYAAGGTTGGGFFAAQAFAHCQP